MTVLKVVIICMIVTLLLVGISSLNLTDLDRDLEPDNKDGPDNPDEPPNGNGDEPLDHEVDPTKDTDGDGMPDSWELQWDYEDPFTGGRLLNPYDPLDAFEDPDNDGYDYDRNGRIDRCEDFVALSAWEHSNGSEYKEKNAKRLNENPPLYADKRCQ
jgi:hypothetical protein